MPNLVGSNLHEATGLLPDEGDQVGIDPAVLAGEQAMPAAGVDDESAAGNLRRGLAASELDGCRGVGVTVEYQGRNVEAGQFGPESVAKTCMVSSSTLSGVSLNCLSRRSRSLDSFPECPTLTMT